MAATALKPPEAFDYERRVLNRWAYDCEHGDEAAINRLCGLTPAGSPPTVMDSIYWRGAQTADDVTGYADPPPPPPDADVRECHDFMQALRIFRPSVHEALVARHRRLVHGERQLVRSDSGIATALYGLSMAASKARLRRECEIGYAALREWLTEKRDGLQKQAIRIC